MAKNLAVLLTLSLTFAEAPKEKKSIPGKNPEVIFETTLGNIVCELFAKSAMKTVANFMSLAQGKREWVDPKTGEKKKSRFYDGLVFHRVIPNFMIQGGDPIGNGTGGPGYQFEDEFDASLKFDQPGRLAMANAGPNTNGSQFFITTVNTPWLNGKHTIFGQCDAKGLEVVREIANVSRDPHDRPLEAVVMKKVIIREKPLKKSKQKK